MGGETYEPWHKQKQVYAAIKKSLRRWDGLGYIPRNWHTCESKLKRRLLWQQDGDPGTEFKRRTGER